MSSPDVLIAGAGPAGAVAARQLAAAGRRVVLCDRSRFPRDKACGDGLIADSIGVLRTLGLEDRVRAMSQHASRMKAVSPGGVEIDFDADFLVIPRLSFDHLLFEEAISAGATFEHVIVERPILESGQVVGIEGRRAEGDEPVAWRAPLTILATGGEAAVLKKFDPAARSQPSGMAIRAYARLARAQPLQELIISLERELLPGYAWAFPAPAGLVNVGVGVIGAGLRGREINLRKRLDDLVAGGGWIGSALGRMTTAGPYRGAPLRTGLSGARMGAPGLAIIGEAAGTTYAVSGEGIGKAMESGLLIAETALASADPSSAGIAYAKTMADRHASRFNAYATAERWLAWPFIADYVARRANRSQWVHDRLTGIITERALPNRVFSARSLWKLLTRA